jgi:hypothetical protein
MAQTTTSLIATATVTTTIPFASIHRRLFLEEYIASNCTIEFDPSTSVDNTIGTYTTNYLIGVIGVVLGILFVAKACGCCCCVERSDDVEGTARMSPARHVGLSWQAIYFLLAAAGYAVAGVQHQIYQTKDEIEDAVVLTAPSLVILSMIALQLSVTETWRAAIAVGTNETPRSPSCNERSCTIIINLHYLVVAATLIATTVVLRTLLIAGIYSLVVVVVMTAYYIRCFTRCHLMRYVVAFGNVSLIAGMLVQVLLTPSCGSREAYKNCFRDCPLPDPMMFNHNALFHSLVAVGMIFQGIGWWYGWPVTKTVAGKDSTPFKEDEVGA